jgi:hypothetical protein
MKIFGSWSVISFLRLTAQFIWAVLLATLIIQGLMLGLMLYSGGVLGSSFPVHINYSGLWTTFIELTESDSVVLSAKSLPMDYAPIGAGIPLMLSLGLFQLGLSCLALYGFSILKRVLDAMYRSDSFTVQNGSDIRIIGILLLIAAPVRFLYEWAAGLAFNAHVATESVTATVLPPFDFTLLFAGLICFVLAEIFNQASIIYEEQKLTV